jgi:hypothetical protein
MTYVFDLYLIIGEFLDAFLSENGHVSVAKKSYFVSQLSRKNWVVETLDPFRRVCRTISYL